MGIIPTRTEKTKIHFLSDVLVAVASLDLRRGRGIHRGDVIFPLLIYTLFFYKNIFYKNIKAEIRKILRIFFKNKPQTEILERIYFCVFKSCKYNAIICFPLILFSKGEN